MVCITGRATNFGGGQDEIRRATFFGVFGENFRKKLDGPQKKIGGPLIRPPCMRKVYVCKFFININFSRP